MEGFGEWLKAGMAASAALWFGEKLIKPGVKVLEVAEKVEEKIKDMGAKCAFPANISINSVAAHYCAMPKDPLEFKEGDIIKLDVGAHVNGCIADNATTISLTKDKDLEKAARKALDQAIKVIQPGTQVRQIGQVIEETIKGCGFNPIRNLGGHSIEKYIVHAGVFIPNYDNGDKRTLSEGMTIALEPFATTGMGMVKNGKPSGIYRLIRKKPVRNQAARKILETVEKEYKTLPWAKRWIRTPMAEFAISLLEKEEAINQYAQLVEQTGGVVSQAEHAMIVKDKPLILTKKEE
ncbi:type II methionyl aminopeptidase [Candidatus Woesearchaeota archaeon]|nr:type II methionyl aminopeptidase [Candidatus Woesearchaeota archaeon]